MYLNETHKAKILELIPKYILEASADDYDELYKWELVDAFKKVYNSQAQDLKDMLNKSFNGSLNLLASRNYYPLGMLTEIVEKYPSETIQSFTELYNESNPIDERIDFFKSFAQERVNEIHPDKKLSSYQDDRAIAVYLSCMYPDKYFFYKSRMLSNFLKQFDFKIGRKDRLENYWLLCKELKEVLKSSSDFINFTEQQKKLNPVYQVDTDLNIFTQDFIWIVSFLDDKEKDESVLQEPDLEELVNISKPDLPLNTILYGPPGTGKTYGLLNDYVPLFQTKNALDNKKDLLLELAQKYAWWEIITFCMLDLETTKVDSIYHHELLQSKIAISENKTPRNTIWAWLQRHTKEECKNVNLKKRDQPLIFTKDEKSVWSIDEDLTREILPDLVEEFDRYKKYAPSIKTTNRFETVTFHQSYAYEDFVEGIKPELREEESDGELSYTIEPGIFKKICTRARKDPDNNFALFIDEINRGNVAAIFGELITLIEDDKREGCKNAMEITLPYSKTKFSVPSNLYIIGTMNTADRSVEALDTALRRRFSFVEISPQPDLIAKIGTELIDGINLVELLTLINKRIEKLVDKDHMIGHSYFLRISKLKELKVVFQNKIIPLLQEYFFGDYGKIGLVLGTGFFENGGHTENEQDNIFAEFNGYDSGLLMEKPIYHLLNVTKMKDDDFKSAITLLVGNDKV